MKKVLIGIALLLILLVVVGNVLLDHLAKAAIEVGGERAMGVPTSLESITLNPIRGEGSIEGLKISNPKGFETPFFMNLAKGEAALDMGSLSKDTVVMKTIELDGLRAHLEKTREGSNYEHPRQHEEGGGGRGPRGRNRGRSSSSSGSSSGSSTSARTSRSWARSSRAWTCTSTRSSSRTSVAAANRASSCRSSWARS